MKDGIEHLEDISDEDDIEYENYGLFYLGKDGDNVLEEDYEVQHDADILTESNGEREPIHEDLDPGYYFFPDITDENSDGLNLSDSEDLGKLVKIEDKDEFDLDILNIGLVFGPYR